MITGRRFSRLHPKATSAVFCKDSFGDGYHFVIRGGLDWANTLALQGFSPLQRSFPLNTRRRLGRHVQHDAVHMRHLIDNPCGNRAHDVVRDARPVGGHEVVRRDCADGDSVVVRPLVAHDAHGADARQDGEILVDIGVQTGLGDFLAQHRVALADNLHLSGVRSPMTRIARPGPGNG